MTAVPTSARDQAGRAGCQLKGKAAPHAEEQRLPGAFSSSSGGVCWQVCGGQGAAGTLRRSKISLAVGRSSGSSFMQSLISSVMSTGH